MRDCSPIHPLHRKRGFTLIEILIVGAIIAIFAGIAIFSVQQMYDSNRGKAIYDETRSIGTALALAHDDLGFFPRISVLGKNTSLVTYQQGNQTLLRPGFDVYGTLTSTDQVNRVLQNWNAPYTEVTEARRSFSQGQRMLVKMRLPESDVVGFPTNTHMGDISLVDWPADTWGNPYVLYVVSTDTSIRSPAFNPMGVRLIDRAGEFGNFWVAVVSYGPNGIPGGINPQQAPNTDLDDSPAYTNFVDNILIPARLYVPGDLVAGDPGAFNTYTLKSHRATGELNLSSPAFRQAFGRSIYSGRGNPSEIGIRDTGSDDIWWAF